MNGIGFWTVHDTLSKQEKRRTRDARTRGVQ
jgi:hypothetical protein